MSKAKSKDEENERGWFVYLGLFKYGKEKQMGLLPTSKMEADNGLAVSRTHQNDALALYSAKSSKYFFAVGGVYSVEVPDKGVIIPGSAKYIGWWGADQHNGQLLTWQADAKARQLVIDADARHKRAGKFDALKEQLAPVRQAYRLARGREKSVLLARIVLHVTGQD